MSREITSAAMQKLLGIGKVALNTLAKRGIAVRGEKRGTYRIETITRYCEHLRKTSAGRGGEAAEEIGQAQAALAGAKVAQLRSELVEADAVEKLWTSRLQAFRNRILGVPQRGQYLSARQTVVLQQELRAALDELADEAGEHHRGRDSDHRCRMLRLFGPESRGLQSQGDRSAGAQNRPSVYGLATPKQYQPHARL